jgi:pilus assembly protein Flp/PilA
MIRLISKYQAWKIQTDGATAIEYGLIAAGIAIGISAVVFTFGDTLTAMFQSASDDIAGAGT